MVDLRPDLASYSRVSYLRELHGDLAGAIEAMELALEAGGPTAENTEYVRVQLGHLFLATGDTDAAEAEFATSLANLPGSVPATAGLARVRAAQGRLSEAIELYRYATERIPLPELVVALGEAYEAAGHDAEARDQYALAEAMQALFEANGVQTDLELAAFFADHGDPQRAVELARDAYARTPSVRAADVLGWALFKAGTADEATRYADEALRLGWHDARVLFHAGLIADATGQADLARDRLGRALELNPAFSPLYAPAAIQALARLEADR
jgi:tetratricopeptide (TPR) repeat protein